MYISLSLYIYIYISIYQSINLSIDQSINLSINLSIYLSIYQEAARYRVMVQEQLQELRRKQALARDFVYVYLPLKYL